MSCEVNTKKVSLIAQVTAGISRMSSQQAFAVGVGAGASGTALGAALFANRRRIVNFFRRQKTGTRRPISLADGAAEKSTPIPIPGIGSKSLARSGPIPIPGIGSKRPANSGPIPIPGIGSKPPTSLRTELQPASITIRESAGSTKQTNGYEVLRASGASTGLALTPYQNDDKHDRNSANGSAQRWSVTHMNTGMLIDGPIGSVTEAHELANRLSPLRWTTLSVPEADMGRAQKIVTEYRQSLADKQ
jgi:hypothetical protein